MKSFTLEPPETAGTFMQFLQAVNKMRTVLPELAVVMQALRDILEKGLKNNRRTRRVADKLQITEEAWTEDWREAWDVAAKE